MSLWGSAVQTYMVNEDFYSLPGAGIGAGTANVFIQCSGCSLSCSMAGEAGFDCDTEFASGRKMSADELRTEIIDAVEREIGDTRMGHGVIFTGGEPALQVDEELIRYLKASGYYLAIETNGTVALPNGLDWVCVSPKSAEHTIRQPKADEVKYVRNVGQGVPRPACRATHQLISPAFRTLQSTDGRPRFEPEPGALEWCIKLVKENPAWRLSVQQHKGWGLR